MSEIIHDQWLSQILGCAAFKVKLDDECLPNVLLEPPRQEAFYSTKVSITKVNIVKILANAGFHTVDVNLTLERLADANRLTDTHNISVEKASDEDRQDTLDIAESCFKYSRFHLDPDIPNPTANKIKREWINNYFNKNRGSDLFIAKKNGKPVGFLAVLEISINEKIIRIIDLLGVSINHQRQNIGKTLTNYFIKTSSEKSEVVRVGTQAANIPSLQLYESCGFRIVNAAYVMHAHRKKD